MTERILNDRYALESKVGEGGMAVTYRARDLLLNRIVAIKMMREQFTSDPKFIERFRNEAQAAARLSHENIASVYDTGSANGTYYIVMEFVEGTDLKQRLRRDGPLPVLTALEIGRQIAAALEAAHAKSLVHRDIKPHNILLNREGKVKVTDFGIAKLVSDSEDTGVIIGSVHYLSPEQARGDATTPTSDLYALGCVLFEVLTGRTVFEGENSMAVAHKQIYEPAPHPRSLRPEIPPPVEALILRCLQKDPAARFQTAAEVKNALSQLINHLAQEETTVIPAPPASDSTIVYRKPLNNTPPQRPRSERPKEKPLEVTLNDEVETRGGGGRGWVIALIFVILAAAVTYGIFWMFGDGPGRPKDPSLQKVSVPSVLGLDEANAKSLLTTRKLIAQRGKDEPSAEYEKGKVCNQSPAAGAQVDANTPVFYYVSAGAESFTMPDVGLMSIAVAKSNIRTAADDTDPKKPLLVFVATKEASETVPKGFIIRTVPAANTPTGRKQGTKITLVISDGHTPPPPPPWRPAKYTPGKAMSLDPGDTTVYIKIELENPVGSDPQTLLTQTFKTGEDIPEQRFDRLATDTAIIRMYAARDENSALEEVDMQKFEPAPEDEAPPPTAPAQ
ncbi:MAG: Stk1 family PASTA domain-containing Ser/Thr kinase [Armatimonadota bacterium]